MLISNGHFFMSSAMLGKMIRDYEENDITGDRNEKEPRSRCRPLPLQSDALEPVLTAPAFRFEASAF